MTRWSIALVLLLATSSARAGGLAWHAPTGCPDDAAVRQAIERRVEASLDSVTLAVDVEITAGDAGFVATVRVVGTDDRTLTSASCDELTDAVAVVVARLATEARRASAPSAITAVAVVAPPPPSSPPIMQRSPWNAGVRTTAMIGTGNVPEVGVAGELAAWLQWRRAFVELAAARWLSTTAELDGSSLAGVDVRLDAAVLRAGWQFGVVRAWIGAELGRLQGTGVGLMAPHSGSGTWFAAGGGIGATWRIAPHVRVAAGLDLEIVIDRVQFALDSGEVIYRSSPIALRGGLGIELGWH